ncbi:transcriptional regulator [Desulfovibrio mangrovi]|uniref:S24 family peptidase n=1 Tax=Desulfovibrio mangrovi TaxID=2976983 RepID=UPI0022460FF2|nr:S24 family peptidase [Desulfovibrio mangrovi]UZP67343.1 transcriptional regulator [Desulfovibrio mangrovi]
MNNIRTASGDWRIREFIAEAIGLVGGIAELARIAGVSERTVYAWKNGERHPSRTNLNRVTEHLESIVEGGWTQGGSGPGLPMQERTLAPYGSSGGRAVLGDKAAGAQAKADLLESFVFVEKAQARPSAGGGSLETGGEGEGVYAFRLDWLTRKTADTSRLRIMEVMGRSMENTLHNGDMCLVNERDKELVEDRIYVIRVHDEIYVKRFSRAPGRYLFRGDNRELSYQDIEVDVSDESLNWEVIGRVIWAGKDF